MCGVSQHSTFQLDIFPVLEQCDLSVLNLVFSILQSICTRHDFLDAYLTINTINTGVIFVICVVTANSDHAASATFFVGEAILTIVWALIIIYFFTHYGNTSIDFETR
jgi:hypothetical protein